ncbi:TEP1 [Candida pseudojiufengensis]|uniref:TEP1 n=1 Tax=Candida pseudojiufengensis TaxID=497109 RepID=UPI002224436D|nr:TEP1 [Candida pseudojiufengensis]KAI5959763.1 TEP1 [Candida pseudojiufengensis]
MKLIKSLIRSIIASPKNIYYDQNLNIQLDLSYINSRVIVSSAPTTSYIESWYRYPLEDLVKYLNFKHGEKNWMLFNFRGEGPGYEDKQVDNRVRHFPFPDHYPPTIKILKDSVFAIGQFLDSNDEHVVVLHCKAGKGRSGTICCAFLIYDSLANSKDLSVDEVISWYTLKRMRSFGGDGVSILSQRRYLLYWHIYLRDPVVKYNYENWVRAKDLVRITKIVLIDCSKDEVLISLSEYELVQQQEGRTNTIVKILLSSLHSRNCNIGKYENNLVYDFFKPIPVNEDVMIGIGHFCYIWFNMFFESQHNYARSEVKIAPFDRDAELKIDAGVISFNWEDIDGFKGTKQQGLKVFKTIEIYFEK